jgi:ABC-type antimicrobial peptide transport system permease subunit
MPVVARTSGDPQMLHAAIRRAVADVDPQQAVAFFQTLEDALHRSLGVQRVVATLTAFFAGMALLLAVVGLYSVLAYAVTQRTSEIGLRMALGAQRGEVIRMILGDGMGLVAVGLGVGLAAAAATSRLLQSQLFGIEPLNPIVYLGVAVLFALIAILACLAPSLRASRIEPIVALRAE